MLSWRAGGLVSGRLPIERLQMVSSADLRRARVTVVLASASSPSGARRARCWQIVCRRPPPCTLRTCFVVRLACSNLWLFGRLC
eukprot:4677876-Alexandrium_andersonii.AAC.1